MKGVEAAEELCRMVGARSLFEWLELPDNADRAAAHDALRVRRRKLQGLQGNPKHRDVARLVIQRYQVLEGVLADPEAYRAHLERVALCAQLPLLDIGVDGVLADGLVTEEELAFLHDTARRLELDPRVALGRLRLRAEARGVSLEPAPPAGPVPAREGPRHPLLPTAWFDDAVSRWLVEVLPVHARNLVEPRAWGAAVAAGLLAVRPKLRYVGFGPEDAAARAEARFDALGIDGASALPSASTALPLADGSADVVMFVLQSPTSAELEEARRVLGRAGRVLVVTVGAPRVTHEGPVPSLDDALWGLCRAARLVGPELPPARSASTFVRTHTTCGSRAPLVAFLLARVAAVQHRAGLGDDHPAVRRVAQALEAFSEGSDGVGSYEVPLVARMLGSSAQ